MPSGSAVLVLMIATLAQPIDLDHRMIGAEADLPGKGGQQLLDIRIRDLFGLLAAPADEKQAGVRVTDIRTDRVGVEAFKARNEAFGEKEFEGAVDGRRITRPAGPIAEHVEKLVGRHRPVLLEEEPQDGLSRLGEALAAFDARLAHRPLDHPLDHLWGGRVRRMVMAFVAVHVCLGGAQGGNLSLLAREGQERMADTQPADIRFSPRRSVAEVEEGRVLAPKFDADGLIPCVTTGAETGEVLMLGYMNAEALALTIKTGEAHYYSRSRQVLWHKGATSGLVQKVLELRIDDDQDAVWLKVSVEGLGASCHVGFRSCFYRAVPLKTDASLEKLSLEFREDEKVFDPKAIYGDAPNPTKL